MEYRGLVYGCKKHLMLILGCCILLVAIVNILHPMVVKTALRAVYYEKEHGRKMYLSNTYRSAEDKINITKTHGGQLTNNNTIFNSLGSMLVISTISNVKWASYNKKAPSVWRNPEDFRSIPTERVDQQKSTENVNDYILEHVKTSTAESRNFVVSFLLDEHMPRFQINHFLSVWSVVKYLQPNRVFFYCHVMPLSTTWWRHTLKITPQSEVVLLNETAFGEGQVDGKTTGLSILKHHGGMVLTPNIIFLKQISYLESTVYLLDHSHLLMGDLYAINDKDGLHATDNIYHISKLKNPVDSGRLKKTLGSLGESDIYCVTNSTLPLNASVWTDKTLVKIDIPYTIYEMPLSLDQVADSISQWAAIARHTLFGSHYQPCAIVPNTYHYLWTESQTRDLNMMEVLSIKSLIHFAKADNIYFHSKVLPSGIKWNDVIKIPSVTFRAIDSSVKLNCETKFDILSKEGGVFMDFNTIVTEDISLFRVGCMQLQNDAQHVHVNYTNKVTSHIWDDLYRQQKHCSRILISCVRGLLCPLYYEVYTHEILSDENYDSKCNPLDFTFVQILKVKYFRMTSLPFLRGPVADISRYVTYGDVQRFGDESTFKVPNVIHYIWFGNKTNFYFHTFLCIYSAFINHKPDKIYFHYEHLPTGSWWQALTYLVTLTLVHTTPSSFVFGQPISIVEHRSDVARLHILQKYGGIYLDSDMFVINSLNPLRTHTFVMAEEQPYTLGNGIILAEKNSSFLKIYLNSYKEFNDSLWGYNSVVVPYKLMLRNRKLIHIGPRDRILTPDWSTCLKDIWYPDSRYYWKDNYVLHLYCKSNVAKYLPFMDALVFSEQFATSTFGQIAINLYQHFKQSLRSRTPKQRNRN